MRKNLEQINEKEAENNQLRRQISSLKQKIGSLEGDLQHAHKAQENMELFVVRGI